MKPTNVNKDHKNNNVTVTWSNGRVTNTTIGLWDSYEIESRMKKEEWVKTCTFQH
jgi:hypothetical protein